MILIGASEHVAARLMAVRMPEAIVNARRRIAWNLLITNVPPTI